MTIKLDGRIDSQNAKAVESDLITRLQPVGKSDEVVLDMTNLEMISSAGLRVILRIRQNWNHMRIINVNSDVYEILDMTGFTQMMPVGKAYKTVSIEGCEEIGHGAVGSIYRLEDDSVIKVYKNPDSLEEINQSREMAKLALVLGIPTAISYDVVRVGDGYGAVFELLNARSFAKIIRNEPEKMDWCVNEFVKMLRKIHGTVVPKGKLPDMRETVLSWVRFLKDHLPAASFERLLALTEAVPPDDHMLHGDYHTRNLELQNDEVLIIDMDTLAVGHPIFELGSIYNSFIGFYELDHDAILDFQGFSFETSKLFWHKVLAAYLETADEARIREVEEKARIIGYTRLIRRTIRRGEQKTEKGRGEIDHWTEELIGLLKRTDSLLF